MVNCIMKEITHILYIITVERMYQLCFVHIFVVYAPINVKPYPPVRDEWGYSGDLTFHEIKFPTQGLKFVIKSPVNPYMPLLGQVGI